MTVLKRGSLQKGVAYNIAKILKVNVKELLIDNELTN